MSFLAPAALVVAVLVAAAAVVGYLALDRRRTAALAGAGLVGSAVHKRRHLPYVLLWAGIVLLLFALARPYATVPVPRLSSAVVLAMDVSISMSADDVAPNRLGAARDAALEVIESQPESVDIGVVTFGDGALTTQQPSGDHTGARRAVERMVAGGGTSLGQGILTALAVITGQPITMPAEGGPLPDLGYWGSATIVLISDGEETGGVDLGAAAELAAMSGVRIETVGVGTTTGTVVDSDGFRMATRLEEEALIALADLTGGGYHRASDGTADIISALESRLTVEDEPLELTAAVAGLAVLLLTIGGLVMIARTGRLL